MFARAPKRWIGIGVGAVAVVVVAVFVITQLLAPRPVAQNPATPSPSPTPTLSPSPTASPTPAPTPRPSPLLSQRITILVLGNDSNPSRLRRGMGKLTDSIIVLSVNAKHTKVSMISFPRDMVDIPTGTGGIWTLKALK